MVCLAGWQVLRTSNLAARVRRHLPRGVRRLLPLKPAESPRMAGLPNIYLWAWERPEDLQFLGNDERIGVAFLIKTIYLTPPSGAANSSTSANFNLGAIQVRPRLQPLHITPDTELIAVVRIESSHVAPPGSNSSASVPLTRSYREKIVQIAREISSTSTISGTSAIQIDFDATLSEHAFYRDLLIEVRKQLGRDFPLSITALASWCIGDRWLADLPPGTIDEAVPMLFRMGAGTSEITSFLAKGKDFSVPACYTSLGLSTDEPFSRDILSGKIPIGSTSTSSLRVYLFSPRAWEETSATNQIEAIQSWHEN